MTATAQLLEQRSDGHVQLRMERDGIAVMREQGSAKCRLPRGTTEAILINTSGGLAGGDRMEIHAEVGVAGRLTLTTQAAERVYRTLGPAAETRVALKVGAKASLRWLPQESILFEGSRLSRRLDVDLAEESSFLAVEALIIGRNEMGERVQHVSVADRWLVRRQGRLIHAEALSIGPEWRESAACLADNRAMATVLLVRADIDTLVTPLRQVLGPHDGVSAGMASSLQDSWRVTHSPFAKP